MPHLTGDGCLLFTEVFERVEVDALFRGGVLLVLGFFLDFFELALNLLVHFALGGGMVLKVDFSRFLNVVDVLL